MKFKDFEYKRADIKDIKRNFQVLIKKFNEADSFEEQCSVIDEINIIRDDFTSMNSLSFIRKSLGVNKEFYSKELDYYDEAEPILDGLVCDYYKALDNSKFKDLHREKYGDQLFNLAEMKMKCISDNIIEELQQEKKLVTEYVNRGQSFKIEFEGEELGRWDFDPYIDSQDRNIRKRAFEVQTELYKEHEKEMQEIFDRFVKLRHKMALKMGYENFVDMGYARMNRIGYDKDMVAKFRKQVLEYVVPLNKELIRRQAERLGIETVKYYDEAVQFLDGNAELKGDINLIIEKTLKMYKELSPETSEFFKYIVEKDLFDVENREGKEEGGFCEYIPKYKAPFIYSVYRGTIDDFNVFTHEAGHAFQKYLCANYEIPEYCSSSEDISEIHSMSMEFLTEPWGEDFFGEDAEKYKFSHMCNALSLLTYICVVDEFQHFIYEKPEATYEERNSFWRELEKKYLPYRDYEENTFLDKGAYWLRQSHIFWGPFYYIDYGLAQVAAFNFWYKAKENREEAWKDYMKVCKSGGSKSFVEVVKLGNLKNPFEEGSIEKIAQSIREWVLGVEEELAK
ncbi:M3 family oligoendopeptidase [Oceanirhabdus seepicola]|uniref:M3 family oligoendopeptidase n=1 Tax=Oceanirhabdus seepicola TaxID=2828781 RepID=A0A9J6NZH0_9CLOT|nr:M3 family oligoendopeptidase [Oceanirhabdus seepicola]MCM1989005.1 M3 family oligoendopeptidase [Oceanirhabdus seepicola]